MKDKDLEKEVAELTFDCDCWGVPQEIKTVLTQMLKNQRSLKYSILSYVGDTQITTLIVVELPMYTLNITQDLVVEVTSRKQGYLFSFKPKSVEHFIKIINILNCLPESLLSDAQRIVEKAVSYPEDSLKEFLVLLKLQSNQC